METFCIESIIKRYSMNNTKLLKSNSRCATNDLVTEEMASILKFHSILNNNRVHNRKMLEKLRLLIAFGVEFK